MVDISRHGEGALTWCGGHQQTWRGGSVGVRDTSADIATLTTKVYSCQQELDGPSGPGHVACEGQEETGTTELPCTMWVES